LDKTISDNLVHSNYQIIVKYKANISSHEGWCSYPTNITESEEIIETKYPLLKSIDPSFGNIDPSSRLAFFYKLNDVPHGNGYCYCKASYSILSALIVQTH
jgi:hypothetical protein